MESILENRFKDRVMIITGASRGIGKETALRAAKEGAKVVIVDLRSEGESVVEKIKSNGGDAIFLQANLSKEEEVAAFVEETVKTYGKIDILINNAGVSSNPNSLDAVTADEFDFVFKTNFYSVFFCCKYVINQMLKQNSGGAIVNTASIGGLVGLNGTPAYVASKHAINGLTKNMAIDYAKYGIRVNSVNPAPTSTPMQAESYKIVAERIQKAIEAGLITKEQATAMGGEKSQNLQHRIAEASEQAASILFLASDDASYLTGTTLQTDGGWTTF